MGSAQVHISPLGREGRAADLSGSAGRQDGRPRYIPFDAICVPSALAIFDESGELELGKRLGKGANNTVYAATWKGQDVVLRVPRRRSDTQARGSAKWEYLHTSEAASEGVCPAVHRAWYVRHATTMSLDGREVDDDDRPRHGHGRRGESYDRGMRRWPSGLYLLMDRRSKDLERVMRQRQLRASTDLAAVGKGVCEKLHKLAQRGLFVYDLKPSNILLDEANGEPSIIDFGCDFCECTAKQVVGLADHAAPRLAMLQRLVAAMHPDDDDATRAAVCAHIVYVTMLVQLSSVTSHHLHADRREHGLGLSERKQVHPFAERAHASVAALQGRHRRLVRALLRADAVRGVLAHYTGRRNAGTRRTLRAATEGL